MSSPPIARRQLSAQMRQKRLDAGMTLDDAAEALEWSPTKISNIETGRSKYPAVSDIGLLLDTYRVKDPQEKDAILNLTRQARQRGWWNRYDDVITGAYTSLEAGATSLRLYEPQFIPGLLQVSDYTAAVSHATLIRDPDEVDRVVEARAERKKILDRTDPPPPDVWAIIDEHALRLLGASDRELHRRQVEHLAEMADAPNSVTLQVLPTSAGLHAGMGGPFVILDYDEAAATVFLETNTDGLYLDKAPEIDRYRRIFDRLVSKAMDPDDVAGYLRSLIA
ncbi:helix-turn-helix domain-containing protein [Nocardiopsis baichengensis]|uniref:helix-turn-helix domain-containing protein n=1 Tax=Nocardiopsis baichengensis TaxID=280240 RepID=UPI00037F0F53|nr:helix-turn-helix transcriptional regulator [Nocardiopsis baichengensis]